MDRVWPSGVVLAQTSSGRAMLNRRLLVVSAALVCAANVLPRASFAAAQSAPSLSDAVGVLERERSAAEQYAVILATVGRKDVDAYVHGIELYADAKSEFDGLIAQLRLDLIDGRDPTKSPKFDASAAGGREEPHRLHQLRQRRGGWEDPGREAGADRRGEGRAGPGEGDRRRRPRDLGCIQKGEQGASRRHSERDRSFAVAARSRISRRNRSEGGSMERRGWLWLVAALLASLAGPALAQSDDLPSEPMLRINAPSHIGTIKSDQ